MRANTPRSARSGERRCDDWLVLLPHLLHKGRRKTSYPVLCTGQGIVLARRHYRHIALAKGQVRPEASQPQCPTGALSADDRAVSKPIQDTLDELDADEFAVRSVAPPFQFIQTMRCLVRWRQVARLQRSGDLAASAAMHIARQRRRRKGTAKQVAAAVDTVVNTLDLGMARVHYTAT